MPCVCDECARMDGAFLVDSIAVYSFFCENGNYGCNERYPSGLPDAFSIEESNRGGYSVVENAEANDSEHKANDERCQCFVFPVSVVMVFVFGFCRQTYHYDDNDVAEEIAKRVHGVGNHSRAVTCKTCNKLEYK